jgi:CheY-like chemotaxis protein
MIFDAFSQADGSTTRQFGGTGLGLTISARLAAAMDGKLWVESTLGNGSCFHFTIRLQATTEEAVVLDEVSLSGMTVLIIDDNRTNRQILTNLVSLWQARPTQAASAQEGLSLMRQAAEQKRPFTLVLTDSHMPGMDGFDLVLQIRNSPHLAESVVLMLTSAQQHGDLSRCKELGISGYLTKPVRRAELRSVITAAFASQEQTAKKATPDPFEAPPQIARRILLAEDNIVNQRVAIALLESGGHQVVVAANGTEAIAAWRKQSFDLILTDIQMPVMDGFEATSEIRRAERGTNTRIPIVAMTAHAMTGDRERCLSSGMDDYISKPIRKSELMRTIARLTKQSGNVELDCTSSVR